MNYLIPPSAKIGRQIAALINPKSSGNSAAVIAERAQLPEDFVCKCLELAGYAACDLCEEIVPALELEISGGLTICAACREND